MSDCELVQSLFTPVRDFEQAPETRIKNENYFSFGLHNTVASRYALCLCIYVNIHWLC
jgi:hypothetical protein